MREHTITVYKLHELGSCAKLKAMSTITSMGNFDSLLHDTISMWEEDLKADGFNCSITWTTDNYDHVKVMLNGSMQYEGTEVTIEDNRVKHFSLPVWRDLQSKLMRAIQDITTELQEEYDFVFSEEYCSECADANEYEFYASGNIL